MADIFDFDSCVNQRESNKVRYWGSEGYGGGARGTPYVKGQNRKRRKVGSRGYCPKRKKSAKLKKLAAKQLHRVQIGTQLKLFWPPTKTWSRGEVKNIYDDGMYEIACHDDPADQGALVYHLADYTFKITHSPEEAEHYDPARSHHEPHPQASRRSSRIPKKRKLFEMNNNSSLHKRPKEAVVPKVTRDVLVQKTTSEEVTPKMIKDHKKAGRPIIYSTDTEDGGVTKLYRDVLVAKKTETTTEIEAAEKMMEDVLVPKEVDMPKIGHPDTAEYSDSETPENSNSVSHDVADLTDDAETSSSVVVSLNRSR